MKLTIDIKKTEEWARETISGIRQAPGPNPFKNASDEEILREILRRADEHKKEGGKK